MRILISGAAGFLGSHLTDLLLTQGHQIVASHVEATVAVDGIDDDALQAAVAKADEGCPFSQLIERAGAAVEISARLA